MASQDWMQNREITDVQTAIQSATVQTALEVNTTALSDTAQQSMLINSPIPRGYFMPTAGTLLNSGVETTIAFSAASATFDPYKMLTNTANTFMFPVDGFYTVDAAVAYTQNTTGAGFFPVYAAFKCVISNGLYAAGSYLKINEVTGSLYGAVQNVYTPVTMTKPFRAGDTFVLRGLQASTGNETTLVSEPASALVITWLAPYANIQKGGGS